MKKHLSVLASAVLTAAMVITSVPANVISVNAEETEVYVTMNVPYADFYADYEITDAAIWEVEEGVDAVSTATTSKFKGTTGLAKGTYNDGKYILGVSIPVKMSADDYEELAANEVEADSDLGVAASYAFKKLDSEPASFSYLAYENGNYEFSAMDLSAITNEYVSIKDCELTGKYGDYMFVFNGITPDGKVTVDSEGNTSQVTIFGAVLRADDGKAYGMTCLENLWFGTKVSNFEIAFSVKAGRGLTNHGRVPFYQFDNALNGAKITKIELITDAGVILVDEEYQLTKYYEGDLSNLSYAVENGSDELAISGIPEDLADVTVSVSGGLADNAAVENGKVKLTAAPTAGVTYTLTISSSNYPAITRTMSTPITDEQISELNKLIAAGSEIAAKEGFEDNNQLVEHVNEAKAMVASSGVTSADAKSLIDELTPKVKAYYDAYTITAEMAKANVVVTFDGVTSEDLVNAKVVVYTIATMKGRTVYTEYASGELVKTVATLDKEVEAGVTYHVVVVSDNYQDSAVDVVAAEDVELPKEEEVVNPVDPEEEKTEDTNTDTKEDTKTDNQETVDTTDAKTTTAKKDQKVTVKVKKKTLKAKKLKKKALKVKAITVKNAKGVVTYKKVSKNKNFKINKKTGKITVKKKTKKKTYKIKVKVSVAGTDDYNAFTKTVTVKIVVK